MIDLRSDTVTQPSAGMRDAICEAEVGDDVIGQDPTVARLEQITADRLGMEAAVFMPSGTMTNQIALRIHCGRSDEFICEQGCHIYNYEQGGYAQLTGLAVQPIAGTHGVLTLDDLQHCIRPENEHMVRSRLLCLENTHNRAGGTIQPYETVEQVTAWAKRNGLRRHLDGARLFNAAVATGIDVDRWASHFDSVSVCFSKGLGAPVGSALAGSAEFVIEARRHRKLFGGGMRQSGLLAAAAVYALENNVDRLAEDHDHAQILAQAIVRTEGLSLVPERCETNIVFAQIDACEDRAPAFVKALERKGIATMALGRNRVRMVTHLDVSLQQAQQAAQQIEQTALEFAVA